MKHAIDVPSVLTGRRVRWTVELSAERHEIPVVGAPPATVGEPRTWPTTDPAPIGASAAPQIESSSGVAATPVGARRVGRSPRIAIATAAIGIVTALLCARYLASDEEYEPDAAIFASDGASTDRGPTREPIATATTAPSEPVASSPPASPSVLAAASPVRTPVAVAGATALRSAASAPAVSVVRPAAATRAGTEPANASPMKRKKTIVDSVVAAPVAASVAAPVVDARQPAEATEPIVDARVAVDSSPLVPTIPTVDEVTITGCLEVDTDGGRFRLANTEGASAPKARSWRSGFMKKRAAPVDLVGFADAHSLNQQVGRRMAATGVLTSRTLKVNSVRVVSPSCN